MTEKTIQEKRADAFERIGSFHFENDVMREVFINNGNLTVNFDKVEAVASKTAAKYSIDKEDLQLVIEEALESAILKVVKERREAREQKEKAPGS